MKEEYQGKELLTHSALVTHLNEMRTTLIDEEGREKDFLTGKRSSFSQRGGA